MQKQKGFTIIELIVVIAIIAVLASIVLVNVTSYINKGKDAAAEGNLAGMVTNYAIFTDGGGTVGSTYLTQVGATGGASYLNMLSTQSYTATTGKTGANWCACVQLKQYSTATYYCVDSSGNKKQSTTACSTICTDANAGTTSCSS